MQVGVLRLRLRAYYDYGYGRTTTEATGERTGVLVSLARPLPRLHFYKTDVIGRRGRVW